VIGSAFLRDREGNLSCASRRSLPAQAWFVERITRPDKSRIVGMIGTGKNIIASPKRLQPLASRPQVRTLGAIIYFDVPTPSGVCFNSFYLSCWPETFEFINLAPPLQIRRTSRDKRGPRAGWELHFRFHPHSGDDGAALTLERRAEELPSSLHRIATERAATRAD
jgi:hypothetical protein